MITTLEDEIISVQAKDGKEYLKSEEFKEIAEALRVLNKHFGTYIFSGFTKDDKGAFVYNNTLNENRKTVSTNMENKLRDSNRSEKEIRQNIRGAETAALIMNILMEIEDEYGISKEVVMQTYEKALKIMSKIDSSDLHEASERLKNASSLEEGMDIARGLLKRADEAPSRADAPRGFFGDKELQDKFIDLDKMFEDGELDNAKYQKLRDAGPARILEALREVFDATVVLGIIKVGEDGEPTEEGSSVQYALQENMNKITRTSGKDLEGLEISAAGCVATSVMGKLSDQYNLGKGFWSDYCKRMGL